MEQKYTVSGKTKEHLKTDAMVDGNRQKGMCQLTESTPI